MTRPRRTAALVIGLVAALMVMSTSVVMGAGLTITSFTPASGSVGTTVVITGSGFTGATGVTFGTGEAPFHVDSDTQITATVPATAPAKGKISVTTPTGRATCSTQFTRPIAPKPTITSFTPASGGTGASVVITGTHLTGAVGVTFGGVVASFRVDSDTQVTTIVPAAAPAEGRIKVTTAGGRATSPTAFSRPVAAAPAITSFTPTISGIGSSVVITGTHFSGATDVTFGGIAATFHVDSGSQITATVPGTAPAKGRIKVTTPAGSGKSAGAWVKGSGSGGAPASITVSPSTARSGAEVRISGSDLDSATDVEFGGVPAMAFSTGPKSVYVTVPSGARSGPVTVTAPGRSWQTASDFTVIPFVITSLSPDRGPVGTQVVITGAGFTGATRLMFNGVDATFTINSDTKITATVPVGATTGTVRVWAGLDSAATSPGVFTVTS